MTKAKELKRKKEILKRTEEIILGDKDKGDWGKIIGFPNSPLKLNKLPTCSVKITNPK